MTDKGPPAELDDVVTTGQRRKDPHEPFPQRPEPVVSEGQHAEKLPGMDEAPDPCADPETALEWNADAAAAEAAKEFARRAEARIPPETLNTREWGCYLYRAMDGSIRLGPITFGPPFSNGGVGSVALSDAGITPSTIVGSVHSHSGGNHLPSSGNAQQPGDIQHLDGMVELSGNSSVRLYIVAQNQGPVGFVPYNQINVYNQATAQAARDAFSPGPEVNPRGIPCPGP
jgi:hypothetical protein